jgi:hypothetical protein
VSQLLIPRVTSPYQVAMSATIPGPRLVVAGRIGPKFEQPQPRCGQCRDFQTVKVRAGRTLQTVTCTCLTDEERDDLSRKVAERNKQSKNPR